MPPVIHEPDFRKSPNVGAEHLDFASQGPKKSISASWPIHAPLAPLPDPESIAGRHAMPRTKQRGLKRSRRADALRGCSFTPCVMLWSDPRRSVGAPLAFPVCAERLAGLAGPTRIARCAFFERAAHFSKSRARCVNDSPEHHPSVRKDHLAECC